MRAGRARDITVAGAAIAFVIVVAALVTLSVAAYAHRLRETGTELARTIPRNYADARARYPSSGATLRAVLAGVASPGWRARLLDPSAIDHPSGPVGTAAETLGIIPHRIPLADATLEIVPDLDALARAGELETLAIVAVFAFGVTALWRFARPPG